MSILQKYVMFWTDRRENFFGPLLIMIDLLTPTRAPTRADTDPPPGAGVRAPTLSTKSLVLKLAKGDSHSGRQYSITRSLGSWNVCEDNVDTVCTCSKYEQWWQKSVLFGNAVVPGVPGKRDTWDTRSQNGEKPMLE